MAGGPNPLLLASVLLASAVATALNLRGRRRSRGGLGTPLPSEGGCVYLDYAATCPIYPEVADAMVPFLYDHWGNPSSGHAYGAPCRSGVAEARGSIATLLGCASEEVAFCSCGSEADNWAILASLGGKRRHVVVSAVEHPAILACVDALAREGRCDVSRVGVDARGVVDPAAVADAVKPGETALVSVMLANNEVGSVMDVAAISAAVKARDAGILVHTDAAQAVGKIDVNAKRLGVDYLTLVGHKFGAPKGVAALYHRRGAPLRSMLFGGGQEGGLRAGTEAVPSVVALGAAAAIWTREGAAIAAHSAAMRDRLRRRLEAALGPERCAVNGPLGAGGEALPNVLSFAVRGARAARVLGDVGDRVAASASGQEKSDSSSLQRECFARARSGKSIHASRPSQEMIARPKISQNEWKTAERGAFEVGNFALLSCPVARGPVAEVVVVVVAVVAVVAGGGDRRPPPEPRREVQHQRRDARRRRAFEREVHDATR